MSDLDDRTDARFWNSITPPELGPRQLPEFLTANGQVIPGVRIEIDLLKQMELEPDLRIFSTLERIWSLTPAELQNAGVFLLQSRHPSSDDGNQVGRPLDYREGIEVTLSPEFGGLAHPFFISVMQLTDSTWRLEIQIDLALNGWRGPYSPKSMTKRVHGVPTSLEGLILRSDPGSRLYFAVDVSSDDLLAERVAELSEAVMAILHSAEEELVSEVEQDVLVTQFHFAPEYKTACQQYLSYFVEFLRDLTGEDAIAELREDAGHVLFSVTPRNGVEALDSVREALHLYLRLPTTPGIENIGSLSQDRAALELQAEVLQLKSKVLFAAAAIDDRDREIAHLRSANEQLIALAATVAGQRTAAENDEPLIPGAVSVTTFKWGGLKLDLPALLRRLRRRKSRETVLPASSLEFPPHGEGGR